MRRNRALSEITDPGYLEGIGSPNGAMPAWANSAPDRPLEENQATT